MEDEESDFWVECNVCKQHLLNWTGSTPCCGSIAYHVNSDGTVSKDFSLFGSINGGEIKSLKITGK